MLRLETFKLHPQARLPTRAHSTDVGYDVYAHMVSETGAPLTRTLHQRGVTPIHTGIVVRPPEGYFVQVCSRSGLATKGLFVANAPGIVDPEYIGEIIVLLYNGGFETQYVKHGDRIAQLVVTPATYVEVAELKKAPKATERGQAGFGSSGV